MAQLGADVEALERLSRKFDGESRRLEEAIERIQAQVVATWWEGRDAQQFKDAWASDFRPQLRKIANELRQAHVNTLKNARQQSEASGT
jgi:uncharacterized protein YukE